MKSREACRATAVRHPASCPRGLSRQGCGAAGRGAARFVAPGLRRRRTKCRAVYRARAAVRRTRCRAVYRARAAVRRTRCRAVCRARAAAPAGRSAARFVAPGLRRRWTKCRAVYRARAAVRRTECRAVCRARAAAPAAERREVCRARVVRRRAAAPRGLSRQGCAPAGGAREVCRARAELRRAERREVFRAPACDPAARVFSGVSDPFSELVLVAGLSARRFAPFLKRSRGSLCAPPGRQSRPRFSTLPLGSRPADLRGFRRIPQLPAPKPFQEDVFVRSAKLVERRHQVFPFACAESRWCVVDQDRPVCVARRHAPKRTP